MVIIKECGMWKVQKIMHTYERIAYCGTNPISSIMSVGLHWVYWCEADERLIFF